MLTAKQIDEANCLSLFLVGSPCPQDAAVAYWQAIEKLGGELDTDNRLAWERMMKSALLLRCVDAGLALTSPTSTLRKRIFVMFCILETEPEMAIYFLPRQRGFIYLPVVAWHGVRAILAAVLGIALVKMWELT